MTSPDSDSHTPPITYTPTTWADGITGTQITSARLNNAESGVAQSHTVLNDHDDRLDALEAAPGLQPGINQNSKGPSTARPAPALGLYYYDTTLHKPLWGTGTGWYDYSGTAIGGSGGSNAPQNFTAVTQQDNTILCSWTPVTGASSYKLYESQFTSGISGASAIAGTSFTFTPPSAASAAQVVQEKAFEITSTAENSTVDWTQQYTYIEDIGDQRGYTGGIVGFTSATGDMLDIVKNYVAIKPTTVTGTTSTSSRTAGPGGVPTPAGATLTTSDTSSALNITSGGTAGNLKVYDGQSHTVGRINITANHVVVQNFKINAGDQYGAYIEADDVTFQNNDIKGLTPTGDGDLNAITMFGSGSGTGGIRILYNTAINYVSGDPGSSHTDAVQTWVSSSHPVAASNVQIIGNVFTGPANPSRDNSVASIHQCVMVESAGRGGNSGGSGSQNNWLIADNTFGDSWNQGIKFDTASTGIVITRNKFVGSSDKVIEDDTGGGITFYSDNQIGSGYGSTGMSITQGAGPVNPYAQTSATTSSNILAKYITGLTKCASIGMGSGASSAASSNLGAAFIADWHAASTDPVWQKVQRDYRESVYWAPAYNAAVADGLSSLGIALYYDTSVNHGPGVANSNDGSFDDIRSRTTGTKPVNGGSETTWLNNFINIRSAVLTAWGDNPSDGRITMFKAFVTNSKFTLATPLTWSIYGDSFTMSTDPTPAGTSANRTYDLWVTANVSSVESAASNHASAVIPYGAAGSGGTGLPVVSAGADASVAHGASFSRTGTVTGAGITASGWRLVVTPADDNTAAKALSWGQPLSLSDEFEYTGAPDPAKWSVYDGPGHAGNGIRNPARATVANGKLTLQGMAGSADTAGMASKLNQQYGKWEVRMRTYYTNNPNLAGTDSHGYHPVCIVWPTDDNWPYLGEYDFIEVDVPGMQKADGFIHYPSINGDDSQEELPNVACDMRVYNNFAIEWTSSYIKTYINGVLWATLSGGGNSARHNIQDMPLGQLTLQLDAFSSSGFTASTMDLEWARIYPLVPVNPNTSLSSTAALSWTAPSTPGTYTLELFATNSSGTATDQIVVTVT